MGRAGRVRPTSVPAKRVQIVSLKMVRESNVMYSARRIKSPEDVVDLTGRFLEDADREKCLAVYLNNKNEPNAIHVVSVGTLNSSPLHPREVFKAALLCNAAAVILVHNHPSGDPAPSPEDVAATKRLVEAGNVLGVELLDHIVVGRDGEFVSLKGRGLI
ncbi:MAG: DNA repair protein RadC [Thermoanaerobacter sp.]|nr:DNA repair protein RadC [Thermoanaerobacter sp.]